MTKIMINESDMIAYEHQTAGHGFDKKVYNPHFGDFIKKENHQDADSSSYSFTQNGRKNNYQKCVLISRHDNTKIYKPLKTHCVDNPNKSSKRIKFNNRENIFYEAIAPTIPDLTPFIPTYFGTAEMYTSQICNAKATVPKFLVLENLTRHFIHPSIIDLKLGTQTYEDDASEEKKLYEISKYPDQKKTGFRISGMKVYRGDVGEYEWFDRKWGQQVCAEKMEETLLKFFTARGNKGSGNPCPTEMIQQLIRRIKDIRNVFNSKVTTFKLIGCSLLIVYEGHTSNGSVLTQDNNISHVKSNACGEDDENIGCDGGSYSYQKIPRFDARLIDFAHTIVHKSENDRKIDQGIIHGLSTIIRLLNAIVKKYDPPTRRKISL